MLDLNQLRRQFAEQLADKDFDKGSFDAALFSVARIAYEKGLEDGRKDASITKGDKQ